MKGDPYFVAVPPAAVQRIVQKKMTAAKNWAALSRLAWADCWRHAGRRLRSAPD